MTITVDDLSARLAAAWKAWEARPGAVAEARAMESACAALADRLGCTSSQLRINLDEHRRRGEPMSHATLIARVIAEPGPWTITEP